MSLALLNDLPMLHELHQPYPMHRVEMAVTLPPSSTPAHELEATIVHAYKEETKLRNARQQIKVLNRRLTLLQRRFRIARNNNRRAIVYNLRIQLSVITGTRDMFKEFAHRKVELLQRLYYMARFLASSAQQTHIKHPLQLGIDAGYLSNNQTTGSQHGDSPAASEVVYMTSDGVEEVVIATDSSEELPSDDDVNE